MHTIFSTENLKRKDLLGRPRRGWVDNIRMYVKEVWREGWNRLEEGPVMGSCELGSGPSDYL
jgi:hypothetical protein